MDSQMLNRWGSDATGREDGMRIFSPDAHHVCVTIPMLQTDETEQQAEKGKRQKRARDTEKG